MAEEEKEEKKKKSKKSILLIIIVLVVLIALAAGAFLFLKKGSSNSSKNTQTIQSESVINDKNIHIKNLNNIIVNLADPSGDRYLKISLALVMNGKAKPSSGGESSGDTLEDAAIKNAIITVLSTKTSDNLLTLSGKEELRKQLIKAINKALGEDVVKDIYFTDFIVQ